MVLTKTQDLFSLLLGCTVTKRNLFDLIQFSKIKNSDYWSGGDHEIGNTPQQGINWIGKFPTIRALKLKHALARMRMMAGPILTKKNIDTHSKPKRDR
jgi:putative restriction endonuclease